MLECKTFDVKKWNVEKELNKFLSTIPLDIEDVKFAQSAISGRIFLTVIYKIK